MRVLALGVVVLGGCSLFIETNELGGQSPAAPASSTPTPSGSDGGAGEAGTNRETMVVLPDGGRSSLYTATVLADAPIGLFHLDEPAGANFARDAISGREAPTNGPVRFGVTGIAGTAAELDGEHWIDVGAFFDFPGTYAFTLEMWVNPRNDARRVMYGLVKVGGDPQIGYALSFDASEDPRPGVSLWIAGPGTTTAWYEGSLPQGLVHVVMTATNAGGEGRAICYVNAERSAKGDWANDARAQPPTTWPMHIGKEFVGTIDEVAIYDKVLPPSRVFEHYRAARP